MIRALVAKERTPNAGNSRGITPFDILRLFEGQTEAARALLSAGRTPNGLPVEGRTALKVAVDLRTPRDRATAPKGGSRQVRPQGPGFGRT